MILSTMAAASLAWWLFSDDQSKTTNGLYGIPTYSEAEIMALNGDLGEALEGEGLDGKSVNQIITDMVLERMKEEDLPWRKSWKKVKIKTKDGVTVPVTPTNFATKNAYRGTNNFLLGMVALKEELIPYFMTYKQATEKGGKIEKGTAQYPVIYYLENYYDEAGNKLTKQEAMANQNAGREVEVKIGLRYYKVFNLVDIQGLKGVVIMEFNEADLIHFEMIPQAQAIIEKMPNRPDNFWNRNSAFYSPSDDIIQLPYVDLFISSERFYSTCFHELSHSTMHKSRMDNEQDRMGRKFGDNKYAEEELVAELSAMYLCGQAGIFHHVIDRGASYMKGWQSAISEAMKADDNWIIRTTALSQKVADYILSGEKSVPFELKFLKDLNKSTTKKKATKSPEKTEAKPEPKPKAPVKPKTPKTPKKATTSQPKYDIEVEMVRNEKVKRLQLKFTRKPSEVDRAILKSNGFSWAPKQKVWQIPISSENGEKAKQAVDQMSCILKKKSLRGSPPER